MNDLFGAQPAKPSKPAAKTAKSETLARAAVAPARDDADYSAKDIEVLEGLEPVR